MAHQGTIVKEGLLDPIVGLLSVENSRVRLKTLETIYHFDRMDGPVTISDSTR